MKRKLRDILDSDKQFIKELASTYSDGGVSTVLINGFDNEDKIIDTFLAASKMNSKFDFKSAIIRTWTLSRASEIINGAFSMYGISSNILLTQNGSVEIADVRYKSDKYIQNSWMPINEDLSIYFPVEGVLSSGDKDLNKFRESLQNDHSKLKIIITTNDYNVDTSVLDDLVDRYILLDSSSKYPNVYNTILDRKNIQKLPYE